MIDNLTIVRAVYSGLSQRQVAATHHCVPKHYLTSPTACQGSGMA